MISFNAIHPRFSANLYTREFYDLCRQRMNPGGVICAWMTQNSMTVSSWAMICRSMTTAFPHAQLWYCNPEHYCLIASDRPLRVDYTAWKRRMGQPGVAADLRASQLDDPRALISRFLIGDETLDAWLGPGEMNTDDRPLVEFGRVIDSQERDVILGLIDARQPIAEVLLPGSYSDAELAELETWYQASAELMRGQTEYWYPVEALRDQISFLRALRLAPDNQDVRSNLNITDDYRHRLHDAIARMPEQPRPWRELGRVLRESGELAEAERRLERAVELAPSSGDAVFELALTRLLRDKAAACATLLGPMLRSMDAQAEPPIRLQALALHTLAAALERQGAPAEQVQRLRERAQALAPASGELFSVIVENAEILSQQQEAR